MSTDWEKEDERYYRFMSNHQDVLRQYTPGKEVFNYIMDNYAPKFMSDKDFTDTFLERYKFDRGYRCYYCYQNSQLGLATIGRCKNCESEIGSCSNTFCSKCSIELYSCISSN